MADKNVQRLPAEELYQTELDALISAETEPVPTGWRMSPRSVLTYLTGNAKVKGVEITPKYMGNKRLVEIAIATLVTDRALLLIGEPGTAKSWLSEHLSAAVNGDSTKVVQGTAGTTEEHIQAVVQRIPGGNLIYPHYNKSGSNHGKRSTEEDPFLREDIQYFMFLPYSVKLLALKSQIGRAHV